MSSKSKPLMVRLPEEHIVAFDKLVAEFGGLQPATILKMMSMSFLDQPFSVQVKQIDQQIRKPKKSKTGHPGANSKRDFTTIDS